MFDQTQFFSCVILVLFILLFVSTSLEYQFSRGDSGGGDDIKCVDEIQIIDDDNHHQNSINNAINNSINNAIDIAKKNSYSFYEYLKQLDENELNEPYEIRTIEFWIHNKENF